MKEKISSEGYAIVDNVFTDDEVDSLLSAISEVDAFKPTFRRSNDLFAIRQFFKEVPATAEIVFGGKLTGLIAEVFGDNFFVVKSIYFDKPEDSNWFVSYHQDLTISVDQKRHLNGYGPWTRKHNQFSVQPPLEILQDNFTVRIHLDDTDENSGALRVISGSHSKGIYRTETIDWTVETEAICPVAKGGAMFMKPLLLHSSSRTTNNKKRRVIHIEFSRRSLPDPLRWAEFLSIEKPYINR